MEDSYQFLIQPKAQIGPAFSKDLIIFLTVYNTLLNIEIDLSTTY